MKPFEILSLYTRQLAVYDNMKTKFSKTYGLAPTAVDIIMFLYNNPEYNTAHEICTLRGIKSGIVSVEVEKLVQQGLIRRQADLVDRRKQRLFLTEKTEKITEVGFSLQRKFVEALNYNLDEQEIEAYHKTSEKILQNIKYIEKEGLDFE